MKQFKLKLEEGKEVVVEVKPSHFGLCVVLSCGEGFVDWNVKDASVMTNVSHVCNEKGQDMKVEE